MKTTFTLIIQATKDAVLVQLGVVAVLVLVVTVGGMIIWRRVRRGKELEAQLVMLEQHLEDVEEQVAEEPVLRE